MPLWELIVYYHFHLFHFIFAASEWLGVESGERNVFVELVASRKKIMVINPGNKTTLRMIDLRKTKKVTFWIAQDRMLDVLAIKVPDETDFV